MTKKILTPIKAIRARCLDCSAGSAHEVSNCPCDDCPLYEYRFGKRPSTIQKNKKDSVVGSKLASGQKIEASSIGGENDI